MAAFDYRWATKALEHLVGADCCLKIEAGDQEFELHIREDVARQILLGRIAEYKNDMGDAFETEILGGGTVNSVLR